MVDGHAFINDNCVGCGHCIGYCPRKTIFPAWHRVREDMQVKMAEYAAALVAGQDCFHVAIAIDITPQCDCFAGNDAPIVPNVGMFASCDPVALDQAVTDRICAAPAIPDSALPGLHEACEEETDHLHAINPISDWELCIKHAEELGANRKMVAICEALAKDATRDAHESFASRCVQAAARRSLAAPLQHGDDVVGLRLRATQERCAFLVVFHPLCTWQRRVLEPAHLIPHGLHVGMRSSPTTMELPRSLSTNGRKM